jgi:hypothetical protein
MKSTVLILLFTSLTFESVAQLTDHKFHLYGRAGIGSVQSVMYNSYSLNAEFMFKNKFGINYNFDYLTRQDNLRNIHLTMGMLGAPVLFGVGLGNSFDGDTTSSGAFGIIGGLVLLALPDGVSYHISPKYGWDISPYANILGLDFIKNRVTDEEYLKYACSFGVKSSYLIDRFTVTGFVETRQAAGFGWSIGGGVGIGAVFGKRENAGTTSE